MSRHNKQLNILWVCVSALLFSGAHRYGATSKSTRIAEYLIALLVSKSCLFFGITYRWWSHDEKTICVLIGGGYRCPCWMPGEGFRWALRTQAAPLPVIIWHQGCWQTLTVDIFFCWYRRWKGKSGGRVLHGCIFPPLSAPIAGLKSVSAAGWMSRVALTCCGKDPQQRRCFPPPSSRPRGRAWHVEQLKHHKCKM